MSFDLYKSSPCKGCNRDEQTCQFAHSIHAWNPSSPKMMCLNGDKCWNKETTCAFLHDRSLADRIRVATIRNLQFIQPHKKPMESYVIMAPVLKRDPLYELQLEKEILLSERESLFILQKKLEVKIMEYRQRASAFWEVGSKELEL